MSNENFTGPDFIVGSTKGIRVWRADSLGRLTGWTHKQIWTPGENVATCRTNDDIHGLGVLGYPAYPKEPCKEVSVNCGCGFWAYHSGTPTFGDGEGVVGIVEGYGRTTIGTKGFRCTKARILAIAFPRSTCGCSHSEVKFAQSPEVEALVRRNYPEVAFFTSVEAMVAEFPPDQPEPVTPEAEDFWTMPDPAARTADSLTLTGWGRFASGGYTMPTSSLHLAFDPKALEYCESATEDKPPTGAPTEYQVRKSLWRSLFGGAR